MKRTIAIKQVILLGWLYTGLLSPISFAAVQEVEVPKIGVSITKMTVLSFPEPIVDALIGNVDFKVEKRGKTLLIAAKAASSRASTLFVSFGERKPTFTAEIYPNAQAALHQVISLTYPSLQDTAKYPEPLGEKASFGTLYKTPEAIFPTNLKQQYYNIGMQKKGITVLVPQIMLQDNTIYLKLSIENHTNIHLSLTKVIVEHVTYTWPYFLFRTTKTQTANPTLVPAIAVGPKDKQSFILALPNFITNGGISIYLGEDPTKGQREFNLQIPEKVILHAQRR